MAVFNGWLLIGGCIRSMTMVLAYLAVGVTAFGVDAARVGPGC